MVLIRIVLTAALLAGCGQSLFDNNPAGDGGTGDDSNPGDDMMVVPTACPAPCIADAGGDFNGTPTGSTGRWRYLDDTRNRAWTAMTAGSPGFTGAAMNKIVACADMPSSAACAELPGALLFTSSGATTTADPAIEFTAPAAQVVQLTLRIGVPAGGRPQVVRFYRSAREDVLFTGTAMPGVTLEHAMTVDALMGDRFLFSLAPTGMGTSDVAVHMFVSDTGELFPRTCHMAVGFGAAVGNTVANLCGSDVLTAYDEIASTVETAPVLVAGPFPELGMSADFVEGRYYDSTAIFPRAGNTTMQAWFRREAQIDPYRGHIVSDMDLDDADAGGISIGAYDTGTDHNLVVSSCQMWIPTPTFIVSTYAMTNPTNTWHFVRVTHEGDVAKVCLDGVKIFELAIPAGTAVSSYVPRIGKDSRWNPNGSYWDGQIDDVRLFTTALPCDVAP